MNARRQVGFIKNYSAKKLEVFQEEPSEFSYFRVRNQDQQDQFSPYKMEEDAGRNGKVGPQRPPLPIRNREVKPEVMKGVEIPVRLKERMNSAEHRNQKSKEKMHTNIVTLRDKIEQLDTVLQELKMSRSSENIRKSTKKEEQSRPAADSSSSSSESQEVVVNSIPSPKMSIERIKEAQRVESINERRDSSSKQNSSKQDSNHQSSLSQRENVITFNSRISNQPLQIKKYSSSSESDSQVPEQESQESQYVEDKRQTRRIQENRPPPNTAQQQTLAKKELHQNRGGICFDIDTKQFTEPVVQPRQQRRPLKKPTKVDKKAEILQRRQQAKAYDKMARKALFTAYN